MDAEEEPAPRLPLGGYARALLLALASAGLALLVLDLALSPHRNKLGFVFVLGFSGPLLVLHELAHALAARSVGWQISELTIGFGRELWRFDVGRARVSLRALPIEAHVVAGAATRPGTRLGLSWIYLAGPLSGVLVVLLCGTGLAWTWPPPHASVGQIALASLALSAALGTLCTLVPHGSDQRPSDGLGLWLCCFAGRRRFRRRLRAPFVHAAERLLLAERPKDAILVTQVGLLRCADDPVLAGLHAVGLAAVGKAEDAFARLEALGPPDARPSDVRAQLLVAAAWTVLFAERPELLPDAERATRLALELAPGDPHGATLLGRIHLERGRPERAYACLMSAYKRARDLDQEAQCVAYLALACAALTGPDHSKLASYANSFAAAVTDDTPPELRRRVLARLSQI